VTAIIVPRNLMKQESGLYDVPQRYVWLKFNNIKDIKRLRFGTNVASCRV